MTNKSVTQASADAMPTLHDYITGAELRPATAEEHRASIRAARFDGGAGVIVLDDGRRCYVTDPTGPATLHAPLDLSVDCTGDDPGATWWECPICGDYAWLAPGQEPPECSCEGDPDTLPATTPGEHYSFLPLDVGFDPRVCGISVELPADAGAVTLDDDGIQRRVEGSRSELVEALRGAGYTVAEVRP